MSRNLTYALPRFTVSAERLTATLLAMLLAGDFVFIGLHVLDATQGWENPAFNMEVDQSLSELFQYVKWLMIALLLGFVAARKRASTYLSWVMVFLYFLLDDSLSIHEQVSRVIREPLNLPHPLVEFLFSLVIGSLMAVSLVAACFKGNKTFRKFSLDIALLIAVLAVFGVGVDLVHPYAWQWGLSFEAGLVEDGGEMLAASVIAGYVLLKTMHFFEPRPCLTAEKSFLCEPLYSRWLAVWEKRRRNR